MDHLKLLRKLGMTEYEGRAYLALAQLGPSTVREIVQESKLPRNKAYEALQRLEQQNKVSCLPLSPRKYQINDPETLREEVKELQGTAESIIKLVSSPKSNEFKELFLIIKGQKAIQEKFAVQNTKAEREILACNRLSKILYKNIRTLKQTVKRGVKVKIICTFEKSKIGSYKAWMSTGAEIRVFNKKEFGPLLPRINVCDGKIAAITIGEPEVKRKEDYLAIWTESRAFANLLKLQFMNMWKKCDPIKKYLK